MFLLKPEIERASRPPVWTTSTSPSTMGVVANPKKGALAPNSSSIFLDQFSLPSAQRLRPHPSPLQSS